MILRWYKYHINKRAIRDLIYSPTPEKNADMSATTTCARAKLFGDNADMSAFWELGYRNSLHVVVFILVTCTFSSK